jgi:hypothetical protein
MTGVLVGAKERGLDVLGVPRWVTLKASTHRTDTRSVGVIGEDEAAGSRDACGATRARDPDDPSTWIRPIECGGQDRHLLTMPWQRVAASSVAGGVLIAVDAHWHVYGRSLGIGIGLLLMPVFTLLFARWVDGPVLCYRTWGRLRRLDLNSVTTVGVGKQAAGRSSITLSAPGLRKPLRVALRDPRHQVPPPAREHLRRWLSTPTVDWDPGAGALFDGGMARGARRRSTLGAALLVVAFVCVVAGGPWLASEHRYPNIAGAPGYHTYGGPHGKVLAVGRPWGVPCRPVRFIVDAHAPDWIYWQAVAVVNEARQDGIDVTIETRGFMWQRASLYYAPGQTPDTTVPVSIFVKDGTPPRRDDGKPEHIDLHWDARLDDGGHHEAVTRMEGILYTQSLGGDAIGPSVGPPRDCDDPRHHRGATVRFGRRGGHLCRPILGRRHRSNETHERLRQRRRPAQP